MLSHKWVHVFLLFACFVVLATLVASSPSTVAATDPQDGPIAPSSSFVPDVLPKARTAITLFDRRESLAASASDFVSPLAEWGAQRAAVDDIPVYQYFVPYDDRALRDILDASDECQPSPSIAPTWVGAYVASNLSLTGVRDGTIIYYDHWEDGYDADALNPGPTTEIGILDAGQVRFASEDIDTSVTPWGSVFYHGGQDRITTVGGRIALVRSVAPSSVDSDIGARLAGSWEIERTEKWGYRYIIPAGEDWGDGTDFEYSAASVTAVISGTQLYYNGALVASLATGGVYTFPGVGDGSGLRSGDVITATEPIQVQTYSSICASAGYWSGNTYTLEPVGHWYHDYWSPVPNRPGCGPNGNVFVDIFLYNDTTADIDLEINDGTLRTVALPPGSSSVSALIAPDLLSGARGVHLRGDSPFWGVVNVDTRRWDFEWGFALIPTDELNNRAALGWSPGNSSRPPRAQYPPSGNVAWVAPITDTVVFADFDRDGQPDLIDCNGDGDAADLNVDGICDEPTSTQGVNLSRGDALQIADPYDADLTGALIFTRDSSERIVVAWGEGPCIARPGTPYLDMGYRVPPSDIRSAAEPILWLDKRPSEPSIVSPGDVLTYTIVVSNVGTSAAQNTVIRDVLPPWLTYVPNSLNLTRPVTKVITTSTWVTRMYDFYETYGDNFDEITRTVTSGRDGNDGTLSWILPIARWTEFGDNGNESTGDISIVENAANANTPPSYLRLTDNAIPGEGGIERCVDLADFVAPQLSYRLLGSAPKDADDFYRVEINRTAVLIEEIWDISNAYTPHYVDLSAFAGTSPVCVGFVAGAGMDPGDYYRIDDIYILESSTERSRRVELINEFTQINYVNVLDANPVAYIREPADPTTAALTHTMEFTDAFSFPPQTAFTATFQMLVGIPLTNGLDLVNTASVAATNILTEPFPLSDSVTTPVQSRHVLSIIKTDNPDPVEVGQLLTYTLVWQVAGDEPAPGVVVTDHLPLSYVSFHSCGPIPECQGESPPGSGTVVWELGDRLLPMSGITFNDGILTVTVRVEQRPTSGVFTNTVIIDDATPTEPSQDEEPTEIPDEETAIELLFFRAQPKSGGVQVQWSTLFEIDTYGFLLYRSSDIQLNHAVRVAFVAARGGQGLGADYSYTDAALPSAQYHYWLIEEEFGGKKTLYGPISVWSGWDETKLPYRIHLPITLGRGF